MALVGVALGSNQGDRRAHLEHAVLRLSAFLTDLRVSSFYDTEPVDVVGEQPRFLNGAAAGVTDVPPETVLLRLLAIESERGRVRPHRGAARTLDLDLVFYGDLVVAGARLALPHPRFRNRRFVLEPLAEVAADWRDPITGLTVGELLKKLG